MANELSGSTGVDSTTRWASLSVLVGVTLVIVGLSSRTTAGEPDAVVVPLHNDRAEQLSNCPTTGPSWNFVIAPNNGTYRFESIVLDVGGSTYVVDGDGIVPNRRQQDDVFVAVPAGRSAIDLRAAGSFAQISPVAVSGTVKFVLSGVCEGSTPTPTTVLVQSGGTTTLSTPAVGSARNSTTVSSAGTATSTAVGQSAGPTGTTMVGSRPTTGTAGGRMMILIGSVFVLVGGFVLIGASSGRNPERL